MFLEAVYKVSDANRSLWNSGGEMEELTPDEIDFLIDLVIEYQDTRDLNQREWASTKVLLDKLDAMLGD